MEGHYEKDTLPLSCAWMINKQRFQLRTKIVTETFFSKSGKIIEFDRKTNFF